MGKISDIDDVLKRELISLREPNSDYWSFRGNAVRQHGHAYFQYPAMMVPQMQGDLICAAKKANPKIRRILDPFVGSGTALTESIMNGMDFSGFDINPLAILLCRAKTIPFFDQSIEQKLSKVMNRARTDGGCRLETTFNGWNKWFRRDAAIALSRIRRSIAFDDSKVGTAVFLGGSRRDCTSKQQLSHLDVQAAYSSRRRSPQSQKYRQSRPLKRSQLAILSIFEQRRRLWQNAS